MEEEYGPIEDRKFKKGLMYFLSGASIVIGVIILINFTYKTTFSYLPAGEKNGISLTNSGTFGDYIGGVVGTLFSLAGVFLLFLTLKEQRENFHRERMESNFFEMIKFHKDNVAEMTYTYYDFDYAPNGTNGPIELKVEKRKVFKLIFLQFKELWAELSPFFKDVNVNEIYNQDFLEKLKRNSTVKSRKINLIQCAQIDITYSIVFFGLSKEDKQTLSRSFSERYSEIFINKLLDFASLKPKKESKYWLFWDLINGANNRIEIFDKILLKRRDESYEIEKWLQAGNKLIPFQYYPDYYIKYYGGHQFRFGHYYRQLYQTVKFIDGEMHLTNEEKYRYIKILRAQLSNYEQVALFLNSISEIGRRWEFYKKTKPEEALQADKHLITKYNLIKNIPMQYLAGEIDLLNYYPKINYEAFSGEEI